MSVLTLAGNRTATDSSGGTDGSGASDGHRVALGEAISTWVEGFLTGLVPGDTRIRVDWNLLSPIVSTFAGAISLAAVYLNGF